jgi:enoyl-CoA hydratase
MYPDERMDRVVLEKPNILLYEKIGKIVKITINRPQRMNAVTPELVDSLVASWNRFERDDDSWVAIITGAGEKAFCAGFDLVKAEAQVSTGADKGIPYKAIFPGVWKPVIAAVNGFAIGGGFSLALSCDIRIASENAEFGIAETEWNMPAPWVVQLTKFIQLGHALEIALWGDKRISAQRAYQIGIVNVVVPKDKLMDTAMIWAERITHLAPRCVQNLKQILYRSSGMNTEDAFAFANGLEQNLKGMEDSEEGLKAFVEKRKPQFKNK